MGYFQKDIETMPREQIRQLQSERLVQTVKRVYDSVECYRKKMDEAGVKPEDIKGIEDITKLPFTVKHDLRENYPFGFVSADMSEITRIHASSGTTGKLTVAAYTKHDIDVWSWEDWITANGQSGEKYEYLSETAANFLSLPQLREDLRKIIDTVFDCAGECLSAYQLIKTQHIL